MGTDELQCLLILGVFVAGVLDKCLDHIAASIFFAIRASAMFFGQAAFFDFAFCPAYIPGAIQISQFAALAGLLKFAASFAVCTAATDFFCARHNEESSSK